MEEDGFACSRMFHCSRNCSNSSQVRQMRIHSETLPGTEAGWASSVSAASIEVYPVCKSATGLPPGTRLFNRKLLERKVLGMEAAEGNIAIRPNNMKRFS